MKKLMWLLNPNTVQKICGILLIFMSIAHDNIYLAVAGFGWIIEARLWNIQRELENERFAATFTQAALKALAKNLDVK